MTLILFNKPYGVVSQFSAHDGRPSLADFLDIPNVYPAGRLDADSRGALLLTNQGELTLRLTHPRYGHSKTYRVWVQGQPSEATLQRWAAGVPLAEGPSLPVALTRLRQREQQTLLELRMGEGRNRQIRRTAALLGHPVLDLRRVAIGPLQLGALPEGGWRHLDRREWEALAAQP